MYLQQAGSRLLGAFVTELPHPCVKLSSWLQGEVGLLEAPPAMSNDIHVFLTASSLQRHRTMSA